MERRLGPGIDARDRDVVAQKAGVGVLVATSLFLAVVGAAFLGAILLYASHQRSSATGFASWGPVEEAVPWILAKAAFFVPVFGASTVLAVVALGQGRRQPPWVADLAVGALLTVAASVAAVSSAAIAWS